MRILIERVALPELLVPYCAEIGDFSGFGVGVWGLRFGVWGLGFKVWGLEFRI